VDPRAVAWWTWQAVLTVLGVLACVAGLLVWLWFKVPTMPVAAVVAVSALSLLASVAYVVVVPRWRYRVHRWETTDEAVYTVTGWFWQVSRIAPVSRIQTVDTARGPLQQLLGLASVVVTTASAAGPVRIHGLGHERAVEIVDRFAAATQAADADAT